MEQSYIPYKIGGEIINLSHVSKVRKSNYDHFKHGLGNSPDKQCITIVMNNRSEISVCDNNIVEYKKSLKFFFNE